MCTGFSRRSNESGICSLFEGFALIRSISFCAASMRCCNSHTDGARPGALDLAPAGREARWASLAAHLLAYAFKADSHRAIGRPDLSVHEPSGA